MRLKRERDHGLGRGLVAPHRLGHEEGHGLALGLLGVGVGDMALTDEHVTHDDGAVVDELLLTVEDDPALGHERADDLAHGVALGLVGGLGLGELAPGLHDEGVGGGHRDGVEAGLGRGPGVAVDAVGVTHRRGEVGDRPALDDNPRLAHGLADDLLQLVVGHRAPPPVGDVTWRPMARRDTVPPMRATPPMAGLAGPVTRGPRPPSGSAGSGGRPGPKRDFGP